MLSNYYHVAWMIVAILLPMAVFSTRYFAFLDAGSNSNRESNIDGLRYLLAALVSMHHFSVVMNFISTGQWAYPTGHLLDEYVGFFAVCIFFMISSYLFWPRCLDEKTNWARLIVGRFFRIAPMFIISSLIILAVSFKFGNDRTISSFFVKDVYHWFDFGLTNIKPDVFGFKYSYLINSGVMWTLPWEWMLYLSLPLLSLISNKTNSLAVIIAILFVDVYLIGSFDKFSASLVSMFIMGALAYEIKKIIKVEFNMRFLSMLSTVVFVICAFIFIKEDQISISSSLLYGLFFITVCLGGNPFGLLRLKGAIRLGEVSFSIYLIHGILWYIFGRASMKYGLDNHAFTYYTTATLVFLISCLISSFTYYFIEMKAIKIGKEVQKKYL